MEKLYNGEVRFTFYFNDFTEREFFFSPEELDPTKMFIEINLAGVNFNHLHHLIIEFPNYTLFSFNDIYYKITDPLDYPNMFTLRVHNITSIIDEKIKSYNDIISWIEDLYKSCAEVRLNGTQML